jgi:uncharacterized SAM-dependent methyltransferase
MLYFTNQELAVAHHVSVRTVRNWIESAKAGKLDLVLHGKGERTYVANTSRNMLVIKRLAENGKKYRPHRSQKTVSPKPEFYDLYTQEQLFDIVSNLEINHEIPRQYNYFGEGAKNWDNYAIRLSEEDAPSLLNASVELLEHNKEYLDHLLQHYEQVNIIDIGVGNAMPVKKFLSHLLEQNKLGRYIAIDISPTMLEIAEKNIKKWFGDKIDYEGYALDIDHDRFGNLLAEEYIKTDSSSTTNVVLFVGGTIANFKKPGAILQVIHDSMGVNDFLIHHQTVDTQLGRHYFDFNDGTSSARLAPNHRYIFDLLNIDDSLYEVEMGFDSELSERYVRVALKIALSIRFRFEGGERILSFNKGDTILLWRHRHNNLIDIMTLLTNNDFSPIQVSQAFDQQSLLTISRIKHD